MARFAKSGSTVQMAERAITAVHGRTAKLTPQRITDGRTHGQSYANYNPARSFSATLVPISDGSETNADSRAIRAGPRSRHALAKAMVRPRQGSRVMKKR